MITHLLPGPVLGPRDTSMTVIISALKELKSEEEMTFKLLLCAMRRDNIKIFAKLGEPRGAQMRMGSSLSDWFRKDILEEPQHAG